MALELWSRGDLRSLPLGASLLHEGSLYHNEVRERCRAASSSRCRNALAKYIGSMPLRREEGLGRRGQLWTAATKENIYAEGWTREEVLMRNRRTERADAGEKCTYCGDKCYEAVRRGENDNNIRIVQLHEETAGRRSEERSAWVERQSCKG